MIGASAVQGDAPIDQGHEDFIKEWYRTIIGDRKDFDDRYAIFMGDKQAGPGNEGHHRKILRKFINVSDKQLMSLYLLLLYHCTEDAKRASTANLRWRIALLLSLWTAGAVFLYNWSRASDDEWSLLVFGFGWTFIFLGIAVARFYQTFAKFKWVQKTMDKAQG